MDKGSLDLFENAVDSLQHGITHLADFKNELTLSDAKQSVMNLVNAIDLLVLEMLQRIDKDAIYISGEDTFGIGYRATIHVDKAYKMIRKHLNKPIEGPEWDAYQILKILRNSANHSRFSFGDERKENIIFLLHYIARFISDDLDEKLESMFSGEEYALFLEIIEGTEYGDVLYERKEAARIEIIRDKIWVMNHCSVADGCGAPVVAEWPCNECGEEGISLDDDLCSVGKCAFCGTEHNVAFCGNCSYPFDADWEGISVAYDNYLCDGCWSHYMDRD